MPKWPGIWDMIGMVPWAIAAAMFATVIRPKRFTARKAALVLADQLWRKAGLVFFSALAGGFTSFNPAKVVNLFGSAGPNFVSGKLVYDQVGARAEIFTESIMDVGAVMATSR